MANETSPNTGEEKKENPHPADPNANQSTKEAKTSLVDNVINRVNYLVENGGFVIPPDYNVNTAVRAAYFMIGEVVDKDKRPALDVCTPASVSEAIFRMTMQGLDPVKLQCYFIVNGNKLSLRRSYMGAIVVAKRVADLDDIAPKVIRQGDVFTYEVVNGFYKNVKHESKFEDMDNDIIGAYAVATFTKEGVEPFTDIMTMKQIKESWKMSINQSNNKLQANFGEEACKRTIIARTLKPKINASTDANMYMKDTSEDNEVEDIDHEEVQSKTSEPAKTVALPPAQPRQTVPQPTPQAEPVKAQTAPPRQAAPAQARTAPKTQSPPSDLFVNEDTGEITDEKPGYDETDPSTW